MSKEYKATLTEGCIAYSFQVNDMLWEDVELDERGDFLDALADWVGEKIRREEIDPQEIVLLFNPNEFEQDEEPCEQCGDTVSRQSWSITQHNTRHEYRHTRDRRDEHDG